MKLGALLPLTTVSWNVSATGVAPSVAQTVTLIGEARVSALVAAPVSAPVSGLIERPVPAGKPVTEYESGSPSASVNCGTIGKFVTASCSLIDFGPIGVLTTGSVFSFTVRSSTASVPAFKGESERNAARQRRSCPAKGIATGRPSEPIVTQCAPPSLETQKST